MCDFAGKHDVGSLSRAGGRHSSFAGRFKAHDHSHNHAPAQSSSQYGSVTSNSQAHAHPTAEPMSTSSRPRRGE